MVIKIDTDNMENGQAVADKLGGGGKGLPWMTILDASGEELATSDGPSGNVGCPVKDDERAHFVSMIRDTAQHADAATIEKLAASLKAYAATL